LPDKRIRIHTSDSDPDPEEAQKHVNPVDPDSDTEHCLFDFSSLKNDVNVPSKRKKQKSLEKKIVFYWHLEGQ
jgi:hypothetical protein